MSRKSIIIILCAMIIAVLVFFSIQPISDPAIYSSVTIEIAHAAEVRTALFRFAEDHGGKYPNVRSELPLNNVSQDARRFHDPKTKQDYDWFYYPGYTQQSPAQTIILASPRSVGSHKRIAVVAEGSTRFR